MIDVRRAADRYRGGDEAEGIDTRHAFSFSGFYDPDNVGFGLLMACNEERLAPGAGFAEHPHRDVEIVTVVIEGELSHEGLGASVLRAGEAQVLSAGSGVRHAERNAGAGRLRFLQMWLRPGSYGAPPAYASAHAPSGSGLTLLASASPEAPLPLRQPAAALFLGRGPTTGLPPAPFTYVHVLRGTLTLASHPLSEGDSARLTNESVTLRAPASTQYVLCAMDSEPTFG